MPTYWCHSDKLNLGRCDSFRRKGWGVCRACWVDKIEGKKELEEAYRSWWTEEKRTHLNASDEKVWPPSSLVLTPATPPVAPPPPPSTSLAMLDDMRDVQPPQKKQRQSPSPCTEIRQLSTSEILYEMSLMVRVLRERSV